MSKPAAPEANALYNRYRPRRLSEVIGQEHVTVPLGRALKNGKVNHAYLFSGPPGCGKTSTARIMAASLICVNGPTPDPCGVCEFCVGVANESCVDVEEIDAASNGGVEDARALRDKAHYSPVSARFKVYIIDEAHMVTQAGFNALLKLVEEPPDYVKFIFATTDPEKVLGTIKSRTRNYRYRLVSPKILAPHITDVVTREGGSMEDGVLPLILKEARGQVRNALSMLGQLLDGSDSGRITREEAADLRGAVSEEILDGAVNALVDRSPAAILTAIGAALDEGADAKNLAEDLLDRLRDLLVLVSANQVPALAEIAGPERVNEWTRQAKALGIRGLTACCENLQAAMASIQNGAAARVALEVACTRMMISLVDTSDVPASLKQVGSALSSLMKQIGQGVPALVPTPAVAVTDTPAIPPAPAAQAPDPQSAAPVEQAPPAPAPVEETVPAETAPAAPAPVTPQQPVAATDDPWAPPASNEEPPVPASAADDPWAVQDATEPADASAGADTVWDNLKAAVTARSRATSVLLGSAELVSASDGTVTVRLATAQLAKTMRDPRHSSVLSEAAAEVLGGTWRVNVVDGAGA